MSTALLAIGIALVVFGAVVLLRYADRPGGTVKLMGMEVTSTGAGLPLIALGIAAAAFALTHRPSGTPSTPAPLAAGATPSRADSSSCSALAGVAADRITSIEAGMQNIVLARRDQDQIAPLGIVLTENGQRLGMLRLRVHHANGGNDLYKIEAAVDATCQPLVDVENISRGGDPRSPLNWDTIRLRLGTRRYDMRLGGEGEIGVGFFLPAA